MSDAELPDEPTTTLEVQREARRQDLIAATISLAALSGTIGAIFTFVGVAGVVAGIVIATRKTTEFTVFGDDGSPEYRTITLGVAISVASFIQIGLVVIFTKTAGVIAGYVRYRVGRTR